MAWLFQPLLMLLARSTDSQLARQVEFLHAQNQMLRRRLTKRVRLRDGEKRVLVELGRAVGQKAVGVLLTVVAYSTYRRYVGQVDPSLSGTTPQPTPRKPGRRARARRSASWSCGLPGRTTAGATPGSSASCGSWG